MTVKRQHLVWRKYLSSWTDKPETTNGKIFVYDKKTCEIRHNNINDVAVEKYTYDISGKSDADVLLCKFYLNDWFSKNGILINTNKFVLADGNSERDFIENNYISKLENEGLTYLQKLKNGQFPFSSENKILHNIVIFKQNILSSLLLGIPLLSDSEIDNIFRETLELSKTRDDRFSFFEFFTNQFLRTNRGRKAVLDATESTKKRFPKKELYQKTTKYLFPLMMCVNTFVFAYSLWKSEFILEILKNETPVDFITSDEPIINLCVDYKNMSIEEVDYMVLYYPITPKIALLCKHGGYTNKTKDIKDSKKIIEFNLKMFDAASRQVFSLNKDDFYKLGKIKTF